MTQKQMHKRVGIALLILLAGLALAACNAVDSPFPLTGSEAGDSLAHSRPATS